MNNKIIIKTELQKKVEKYNQQSEGETLLFNSVFLVQDWTDDNGNKKKYRPNIAVVARGAVADKIISEIKPFETVEIIGKLELKKFKASNFYPNIEIIEIKKTNEGGLS